MGGWIFFLLFAAVLLVLLCSVGTAVMRDPYQRLHFPAPISGVAAPLIVAAIFIQTNDFQARAKAVLVLIILFFMNAVLSHATAFKNERPLGSPKRRRRYRTGEDMTAAVPVNQAYESIQVLILALVVISATGVVLVREPLKQTVMISFYGILLGIMFFVFQAPDVALSQITIGAVALPLMILLALSKVRADNEKRHSREGSR
jgi:energy-converting hydrogenase B subunit D